MKKLLGVIITLAIVVGANTNVYTESTDNLYLEEGTKCVEVFNTSVFYGNEFSVWVGDIEIF